MKTLKCRKVDPDARDLKKREGDAGYDLHISGQHEFEEIAVIEGGPLSKRLVIAAGIVYKLKTGIATEIPEGYVGLVTLRSSLALRGLSILNSPGIIDSTFRGEIVVIAYLHTGWITLEPYERIAQLVVLRLPSLKVAMANVLSETERGKDGFGSTGKV